MQEEHKNEFTALLKDKAVVLVAPGRSSETEKVKIEKELGNAVCISVNFDYSLSDFIFLSNLRRYKELPEESLSKAIVTSNITSDKCYMQVRYRDLLNNVEAVQDNAGLMAIKFLISLGVKEIKLAGFDGYSHETKENYVNRQMEFVTRNAVLDAMNDGMEIMLREFSKEINISFITTPKYTKL